MTLTIPGKLTTVKDFLHDLERQLGEMVSHHMQAQLEQDVTRCLYRDRHQRRQRSGRRTSAVCQRCNSRSAYRFSRNGRRPRQLLTSYGVVRLGLPRVVCACGGSVTIPFSILQPHQRWWDDVIEQVGRWAHLGLSLRQMQEEIGQTLYTQVGLRKLNAIVHQVGRVAAQELTSVPPVVMLDAIWVTLLADTDRTRPDSLKRNRRVKARKKVCVLVALGLYPQSGRWGILGWDLAESESQPAWEALLLALEARGVYRQRGVELFIHDGGGGLIAALKLIYPQVPHQRCLFHKLRNLRDSIHIPQTMSRPDARMLKRDLMQQAWSIFDAPDLPTAVKRRDAFCLQYRTTQPDLVASLERDWDECVAYLRVLERYPTWPRSALRTTSLLERVNRMIRRLFRAAGAYHSSTGLLADVARVLLSSRLI